MCRIPNGFEFQVVDTVLVYMRIHRNFHDSKNKHGRFDYKNGQYLKTLSLTVNSLKSGHTDVIEHFALSQCV